MEKKKNSHPSRGWTYRWEVNEDFTRATHESGLIAFFDGHHVSFDEASRDVAYAWFQANPETAEHAGYHVAQLLVRGKRLFTEKLQGVKDRRARYQKKLAYAAMNIVPVADPD